MPSLLKSGNMVAQELKRWVKVIKQVTYFLEEKNMGVLIKEIIFRQQKLELHRRITTER